MVGMKGQNSSVYETHCIFGTSSYAITLFNKYIRIRIFKANAAITQSCPH